MQLHRDRDELLTLLLSGATSSQAVNAYVDKLAGSKLPFQERNLGGGPWVVRMALSNSSREVPVAVCKLFSRALLSLCAGAPYKRDCAAVEGHIRSWQDCQA